MKLIIMRHGECVGLSDNIINGWRDFELTEQGKVEARNMADKLKHIAGIENIDIVYTSYLKRTIDTAKHLLDKMQQKIDIIQDIRLNERHYGLFQGMKREEAYKYPEYNTLSMSSDRLTNKLIPMSDEEYETQLLEYSDKLHVSKKELEKILPKSESILDVEERIGEFFKDKICKGENKDKTILIVGHANTVKLLVKYIERLSYDETTKLRFTTCGTKIYELDLLKDNIVNILTNININSEWID